MALTPAIKVLLAVLRAQPDAAYPLDAVRGLDAEGRADLLRHLRAHGLSGWSHRVFRDAGIGLPSDLAGPLAADHAQRTAHGIVALAAYERLSHLLSQAGIEHVPLKGVRLLETLYPDLGTRALGDLDVLVRKEDVEPADAALRSAGYAGEEPAVWRRQQRYHQHHGYDAPGALPIHIEIHWRLSSTVAVRGDPAELWRHTEVPPHADAASLERTLLPLVHVHGLLIHAATHGYNLCLKWPLDLRLLFQRSGALPSPEELASRARATGSLAACALVLGMVVELAGATSVQPYLRAAAAGLSAPKRRAIAALATPTWFFDRGEVLRQKWPAHALLIALCDNSLDAALAGLRATLFKLDLEGLPTPGRLARLLQR